MYMAKENSQQYGILYIKTLHSTSFTIVTCDKDCFNMAQY